MFLGEIRNFFDGGGSAFPGHSASELRQVALDVMWIFFDVAGLPLVRKFTNVVPDEKALMLS